MINQEIEVEPAETRHETNDQSQKAAEETNEYETQIESLNIIIEKQRELMISLTESLKEREEKIARLQKEIELFDKIHQDTKEALNRECLKVQLLEKTLKKNNISLDYERKMGNFDTIRPSPSNKDRGTAPQF